MTLTEAESLHRKIMEMSVEGFDYWLKEFRETAYDEGYEDGNDRGYSNGYEDGISDADN